MKKSLLALIIAAGASGCASLPQAPQLSFPDTCINMGYKPGTEPFLHCLELVSNHSAQIQAIEQNDRAARMDAVEHYFSNRPRYQIPLIQPSHRINVYHY